MARIRSPGYPNQPLEQVIDYVRQVHGEDRQHPIDRETIARHMGFSGLSGSSDRALSALMHFGLMEKVKKGEMRVTDLALRVLHPQDGGEAREALHEAGFSPELFKELRDRYPGAPPSRDTLSSYLSRRGFAAAAISSAAKAYLESCYFLQRLHAYESPVAGADEPSRSAPDDQPQEPELMPSAHPSTPPQAATIPPVVAQPAPHVGMLNHIGLNVQGDEVEVGGRLNLEGVYDMIKRLNVIATLLELQSPPTPDDEPTVQ